MIDTAELRRLYAAATQGEWRVGPSGALFIGASYDIFILCDNHAQLLRSDSMFCAAAHNVLPALLDELDAARTTIANNARDWADDDTAIRTILARHDTSDSYGVTTMVELVERAEKELDALRAEVASYRQAANDAPVRVGEMP